MIDIKTSLTEEQLEGMRDLYVFQKAGVLPSKTMEELAALGLANRHGDVYVRNEVGIGYIKSLGWHWEHWGSPHLPSPERE